jgi:hypothetical protein
MTKGTPNNTSEPPPKDKFAESVMDGIRKAGATADIVYDRERFCLSQGDKDGIGTEPPRDIERLTAPTRQVATGGRATIWRMRGRGRKEVVAMSLEESSFSE